MEVCGKSDVGQRKSLNEDSFGIWYTNVDDNERGIFIVADGVGGEERGEVASKTAVSTITNELIPLLCKTDKVDNQELIQRVSDSIKSANLKILDESEKNNIKRMATTVSMAVLYDDFLVIANVGDSRTYVHRGDNLTRITKDHSLLENLVDRGKLTREDVETPRSDKARMNENVVTKVLGNKKDIEPDLFSLHIYNGYDIFICCDGVTDLLSDKEIESILSEDESSAKDICDEIVSLSNERGGKDNITVVYVHPTELPDKMEVMMENTIVLTDD
ncbi:MAG: protein phosphatase 2C domain-containing protein [Thermoplasmata archaeon]